MPCGLAVFPRLACGLAPNVYNMMVGAGIFGVVSFLMPTGRQDRGNVGAK